ncbi:MAG: hypothetical protein IJ538_04965 [Clostridia bacterium]|nr:hypothetical protein [Clostridia bacterium]
MDKKSLSKFYSKLLNSNQVVDSIFKNKFCIFYINLQEKLTEHDFFVANTYYKENNFSEPLLFISKSYSEDFLNLLNSSNYKIVSFEEVFSVMKNCNIYPEGFSITQSKTTTSSRHKIFFNKLFKNFSRSHFKHFFISGLSLLIFSMFTFYSLYYLLFGSFLILISFVSLFLKTKVEEIKPINLNSFIKKEE